MSEAPKNFLKALILPSNPTYEEIACEGCRSSLTFFYCLRCDIRKCAADKGLMCPGYDPRGLKGVALAYAVSCRGACHLRHMAYRPNLTGQKPFRKEALNRLSYQEQAEVVAELEDFHTIVDCMVLCKFVCLPTIGPILWDELTKLYTIITGKETRKEDLIKVARNINTTIRKFNQREGLNRSDDTLPQRFFNEGLRTGASKGEKIQKQEFEKMLNEYYKLRE